MEVVKTELTMPGQDAGFRIGTLLNMDLNAHQVGINLLLTKADTESRHEDIILRVQVYLSALFRFLVYSI